MMEVVLDTVSLQHLLRAPKLKSVKYSHISRVQTPLDIPMQKGRLHLAVDANGALINEWELTCGAELIQVIVTRWDEFRVFTVINHVPKINRTISKKLRMLGFQDSIDKLVLRLGLVAKDHVVISEDSDFWDPSSPSSRGNSNAPVALLCKDQLGITIMLLKSLINKVC
jgi:hypothetical protein